MIRIRPRSKAALLAPLFLLAACSQPPAPDAGAAPAATPAAAPAVADAAPPAAPPVDSPAQRYEGKIIRQAPGTDGKEGGWYLVRDGKRRWITDAAWLGKNGFTPDQVVDVGSDEFHAIPEDPEPLQ